jgi:hypothetical protein
MSESSNWRDQVRFPREVSNVWPLKPEITIEKKCKGIRCLTLLSALDGRIVKATEGVFFPVSVQVVDVQNTLGAELLYGGKTPPQMSTEVTQYVVATLNLQELLTYFPKHLEPTKVRKARSFGIR